MWLIIIQSFQIFEKENFVKNAISMLVLFASFACGPPSDHRTKYQKTNTYPVEGGFKEPVASVIVDRNDRFDVAAMMGSAFLVNKSQGIFGTAKHVVGEFDVEYKLFFCGRVYIARRILDTGVTDVSFLKITSNFNS